MLHTLFTTTARRFEPVVEAICGCARRASLVNLDDTPVLVLDPDHPKRRRQGRADELAYVTRLLREVARREWSPTQALILLPDAWLARQKQQAEERRAVEG